MRQTGCVITNQTIFSLTMFCISYSNEFIHVLKLILPSIVNREEQTLFRYLCFTSLSLFILNIFRRIICSPETITCISITVLNQRKNEYEYCHLDECLKAEVSSVSPSSIAMKKNSSQWPIYVINSVENSKLPYDNCRLQQFFEAKTCSCKFRARVNVLRLRLKIKLTVDALLLH